jgi:hypothetical protein
VTDRGRTRTLVEETIEELAAGLPADRTGLLAEARDGLEDAVEAYRRAGLSPDEAAKRAVAEFGDLEELRPDYAADLTSSSVRATATALGAGYPVILVAWAVVNLVTPDRAPHGSAWAASSFSLIGVLAVVSTLAALTLLRRAARRGTSPTAPAWYLGLTGLGCGLATLTASYLVEPWAVRHHGGSSAALVTSVEVFSAVTTLIILGCSLQCLRRARDLRRQRFPAASAPRDDDHSLRPTV